MARNAKNTRMCSGCMARKDKFQLICINNFKGNISIGFGVLKKEGRSAYLCPNVQCMEKSIKKKFFPRFLKCELPPDFNDKLNDFVLSVTVE